jgi:hypothetical protein
MRILTWMIAALIAMPMEGKNDAKRRRAETTTGGMYGYCPSGCGAR